MSENNHIGPGKDWKASDFERYYKNNMAPKERHRLEKDALDDPFLQDALDGYAYTHTPVEDIQRIRARINPEKDKAKVIWYQNFSNSILWKVAAMLIVFAGLTWIFLARKSGKEKTELASVSAVKSLRGSTDSMNVGMETNPPFAQHLNIDSPEANLVVKNEKKREVEPAKKTELTTIKTDKEILPQLITSAEPKISTLVKSMVSSDSVEIVNIGMASTRKSPEPAKVEEIADADGSGTISVIRGRVLDTEGSPVPYARINGSGTNQALSSDKDGYFSLNNSGNVLNVNVNALGYETTNAILSPGNPENKIILKETENLALNQIKVKSAAAKSKMESKEARLENSKSSGVATSADVKLINAFPIDGWMKYNQNVAVIKKQQIKIDSAGAVSLSFKVDSTGKPIDIKVVRSLTPAADSAAILIMQNSLPLKEIKKGTQTSAIINFQ